MTKYVLQVGTHSIVDASGKRKLLQVGDIAELNAEQLAAFGDKFKSFEEVKAAESVAAAANHAVVEADLAKKAAELAAREEALAAAEAELAAKQNPAPTAAANKPASKA